MGGLLEVKDLAFSFNTYAGEVQSVRGVSFGLEPGETLGIVGESGCGKSVTAKCIVRLNPEAPIGVQKDGKILFDGRDISKFSKREMEQVRARDIRMIFQDPMTSLNPTKTIGAQISEGIRKAGKISREEAKKRTVETLGLVEIPSPRERYRQYPHEFSGGMRQRVMIALAMAVNPKLLIADEPTTALDVTTQAQILSIIKNIQKEYKTALIMITHDLGIVANIARRVAVMYAGKILESGLAEDIFERPAHPYTWGILGSIPPESSIERKPLTPIPGTPPDLFDPPSGCPFAARCSYVMKVCRVQYPGETVFGNGQKAACFLYHKYAPRTLNPINGLEVKA